MERSLVEVISHSSPFAMLLLLICFGLTVAFVLRVFLARRLPTTAQVALTDGLIFLSVVALNLILLLHNVAQAIYGLTLRGIDSDRPTAVAVENVFFYGSFGVVFIIAMLVARLVMRK